MGFLIFLGCSILFFGIGIHQFRSETPVGFYSGYEPPKADELTDVKAWNRKHGGLWMVYGGGWLLFGLLSGFLNSGLSAVIALMIMILGSTAALIAGHHALVRKYKKR